jgi:hypothetical protein
MTLEEQETTIRFDRASDTATCYTASKPMADKWRRLGWPVRAVDRYGWRAEVPVAAVQRFRKLGPDGAVIKRRAPTSIEAGAVQRGRFGAPGNLKRASDRAAAAP